MKGTCAGTDRTLCPHLTKSGISILEEREKRERVHDERLRLWNKLKRECKQPRRAYQTSTPLSVPRRILDEMWMELLSTPDLGLIQPDSV